MRTEYIHVILAIASAAILAGCGGINDLGVQETDVSTLPARDQIIHYAAQGNVSMLQALIESDPRLVNARTGARRMTPLHIAAINNQRKAVDFLLQSGANPRIEDEDGFTAADRAAQEGNNAIASLLRDAEAQAGQPGAQE